MGPWRFLGEVEFIGDLEFTGDLEFIGDFMGDLPVFLSADFGVLLLGVVLLAGDPSVAWGVAMGEMAPDSDLSTFLGVGFCIWRA
jgi:hypothetical protein